MTFKNPLWKPSKERSQAATMMRFLQAAYKSGAVSERYQDVYQWSITDLERFWSLVWDFCGVIGEKGEKILKRHEIFQKNRFFPEARLNYAENLLRRRGGRMLLFFGERPLLKGDCHMMI